MTNERDPRHEKLNENQFGPSGVTRGNDNSVDVGVIAGLGIENDFHGEEDAGEANGVFVVVGFVVVKEHEQGFG